jgi:biopolymer transport protein ExbD
MIIRWFFIWVCCYANSWSKEITFGKDGLRKEILEKNSVLAYTGNKDKGMIVIIKPSKKSNYKNVIDILDEMAISDVPTYYS